MKGIKKILYVGNFRFPDKSAATLRVIGISKMFINLGYGVDYLCTRKKMDYDKTSIYISDKKCKISYLNSIFFSKNSFRKSINCDTKFVICYNLPVLLHFSLNPIARRNNAFIITDTTEWYGLAGFSIKSFLKKIDSELRMRYINSMVDGNIVISSFLKKYYLKKKQKVLLVPPLIDIKEKKWKVTSVDNTNKVELLYSGHMASKKDNLNNLIEVICSEKYIDHFKLTIIGISKIDFEKKYHNMKDYLSSNIIFIDNIGHKENLKHINQADFFVFFRETSKANQAGFPTKFVEAYTMNTKIITNVTSDIEMYLNDNSYGYLLKENKKPNIERTLDKIVNYKKIRNVNLNDKFDYHNYLIKMDNYLKSLEE